MKKYIIPVIAVVALVLASIPFIQGFRAGLSHQGLGGTTATNMLAENYIPYVLYNGGYNSAKDINTSAFLGTTGTFQVGSSGTTISQFQKGTCNMIASSFTITATTSVAVDCAVTGVVSGDVVFASFATSTSNGAGWVLTQAAASTTAGFVTFDILNLTGVNAVIPASIASSTRYLIIR